MIELTAGDSMFLGTASGFYNVNNTYEIIVKIDDKPGVCCKIKNFY